MYKFACIVTSAQLNPVVNIFNTKTEALTFMLKNFREEVQRVTEELGEAILISCNVETAYAHLSLPNDENNETLTEWFVVEVGKDEMKNGIDSHGQDFKTDNHDYAQMCSDLSEIIENDTTIAPSIKEDILETLAGLLDSLMRYSR